ARERLLDELVWAEAEERKDGIVGLQDLSFEIGHEHRVRGVGNDDVGVERAAQFGAPVIGIDHARVRREFQWSVHLDLLANRYVARNRSRRPGGTGTCAGISARPLHSMPRTDLLRR